MPQTPLEMAKDLILAQIQSRHLSSDQVQDAIRQTYASLSALKTQEESGTIESLPATESAPVNWRKSITKNFITCLECGRSTKQLSARHLQQHGLNSQSYRAKYGIPRNQPLASRATTERRRAIVQEIRPWEKTLTFRRRQEQVREVDTAAETITTAAAQPKRQRKASPKKQAAGKQSAQG